MVIIINVKKRKSKTIRRNSTGKVMRLKYLLQRCADKELIENVFKYMLSELPMKN